MRLDWPLDRLVVLGPGARVGAVGTEARGVAVGVLLAIVRLEAAVVLGIEPLVSGSEGETGPTVGEALYEAIVPALRAVHGRRVVDIRPSQEGRRSAEVHIVRRRHPAGLK